MNLLFMLTIFILLFGGGLLIVCKFAEDDQKFMPAFFMLLCSAGATMVLYGMYLEINNLPPMQTMRGPIFGWQYILSGGCIFIGFGYATIKRIK